MGKKKKSGNRKLSPASAPTPPWIELPGDVTANILQRLDMVEILYTAQIVCTTWRKVCLYPAMWRAIRLCNPERMFTLYATMCRRAVDRSQGELVDLTIGNFGDDELVHYIAERSPNLKRLALISCCDISVASLAQAVKKLPHLVELHLTLMDCVLAKDVEAIGFSCPKLESFSCNYPGRQIQSSDDDDDDADEEGFGGFENAVAIGKGMPNLRHLQLLANAMNNEGLEAILKGCPHLESLDLRQCSSLDLGGGLGKRCREKIKDLKLPSDSISDIGWLPSEPDPYDSNDSDWDPIEDYYRNYDDYLH